MSRKKPKHPLPPEALKFFQEQGKIGGQATGPQKARDSETARKAAQVRWNKAKKNKPKDES